MVPLWLAVLLVPVTLLGAIILTVVLVKICCPTAFFRLQKPPGFILHAITGGKVPPYFVTWVWEDEHLSKWLKDGDVVCCVGAKSGTTWLMNIVHQVRTLGDPNNFLKMNTHTMPWPECDRYPGETKKEKMDHLFGLDGMTNPAYKFNVFKSHYGPRKAGEPWKEAVKRDAVVPVRERPGVKYIICMREGRDVMASFYPFFASHNDEFKKMWGGFPPTFPDWDANFKFFTEEQPNFYFGYCAAWWPYRHDPNVLLLHYNDLKSDIRGCLRKIAAFCDVAVPESSWPLIEEKVSLGWMKKNEGIFKYDISSKYYTGTVMKQEEGSMIRKGEVGDGRGRLTPEQEKKFQELSDRYFGGLPGLAEWVAKGGPVPPLAEAEVGGQVGGLSAPLLARGP
ncbi:unnamed protein product [Prorocentrum cordatum]|uniref:Sulfotransferase domain-containing protein n=1 Tax=Prorocentrum cordatum TaxID=2364126 RepID=A0ABN9PF38_9DINO|nr:unnamed protein product [Polarella glacialis]